MVSGVCFKTHSRCVRVLLLQLTRKFNKNPPCVLGGSVPDLGRGRGSICSRWLCPELGILGFCFTSPCSSGSAFWVLVSFPQGEILGQRDKAGPAQSLSGKGGWNDGTPRAGMEPAFLGWHQDPVKVLGSQSPGTWDRRGEEFVSELWFQAPWASLAGR